MSCFSSYWGYPFGFVRLLALHDSSAQAAPGHVLVDRFLDPTAALTFRNMVGGQKENPWGPQLLFFSFYQ